MSQGFTLRERAVLHFNVADFAVAVERVADSSLRRPAADYCPAAGGTGGGLRYE